MEPLTDAAPVPRRRRRRIALVATMVVALLAAPAIVLASHTFSDVPASSDYHEAITQLAESAITIGCGSGKYCPKNDVNREQMAAFMTRGLGFSASDYGAILASQALDAYVASVNLPAGGQAGGTVYVEVAGDVTFLEESGLCPCAVVIGLQDLATLAISQEMVFTVPAINFQGLTAATGSVNWVFEVRSGEEAAFGLWAEVYTETVVTGSEGFGDPVTAGVGEPDGFLWGNITAQYSPFGSTVEYDPFGKTALPDRPQTQGLRDR